MPVKFTDLCTTGDRLNNAFILNQIHSEFKIYVISTKELVFQHTSYESHLECSQRQKKRKTDDDNLITAYPIYLRFPVYIIQ